MAVSVGNGSLADFSPGPAGGCEPVSGDSGSGCAGHSAFDREQGQKSWPENAALVCGSGCICPAVQRFLEQRYTYHLQSGCRSFGGTVSLFVSGLCGNCGGRNEGSGAVRRSFLAVRAGGCTGCLSGAGRKPDSAGNSGSGIAGGADGYGNRTGAGGRCLVCPVSAGGMDTRARRTDSGGASAAGSFGKLPFRRGGDFPFNGRGPCPDTAFFAGECGTFYRDSVRSAEEP